MTDRLEMFHKEVMKRAKKITSYCTEQHFTSLQYQMGTEVRKNVTDTRKKTHGEQIEREMVKQSLDPVRSSYNIVEKQNISIKRYINSKLKPL